jgi:bacteriophage HK97-gp10 putative tail-component
VAADVSALVAALIDAAGPITQEAAELMRNDVNLSAPVDTGALVASGEVDVAPNGQGAVATLRYTEDYASYLEDGTSEHTITGSPYLSFMWNGQQVIVHSVQHPGSTKHKEWFSSKANDESLWSLLVQSVVSGYVIL